ncbi:MAG TPA: LCP family protein [Aggregatilinea sp.]|jgi:LCP family protein required for cell wall assembly|uniref:LCP family glycopolymer transferase n=1 Tax=Aggregatilinea sp. TaxID=2806333 RepID=UPI002C256C0F|nr:LCP family protein [Aggregatilinea sp.]HML20164.1 LCP family protein [Aggregatilinea sp.]
MRNGLRLGLRLTRRVLGAIVIAAVALTTVGYVVYAANGILDEKDAREQRDEYDQLSIATATDMAQRLTSIAISDMGPDGAVATQEPAPAATETPDGATSRRESETIALVAMQSTLIPTNTARATIPPTNTPRPTATPTVSITNTPSITPSATLSPTPTYVIEGTYTPPVSTPVVPIPARAEQLEDSDDIINFLLLGSDTSQSALGQTDVIIVVSVNKQAGSVAMWHVPRDLFVYIPGNTMDRINRAYAVGEMNDYPGGGFGLMQETFLYNFGIPIDHYARVDFSDYMRIVEELGGLEISVDCSIEDWRLIDPNMDPTLEESYERFTLPIGRQTLTPYMALWYVRSRYTTSDLDRGRRQMDALRAMWQQALAQGLFTQVTQLWPEAAETVETDMSLTDVLSFVPMAVSLDISHIARYSGSYGEGGQYIPFLTPDDGRSVFLPDYEKLTPMLRDFMTPPTTNRTGRQAVTVEIVDGTLWNIGFDLVAADRLAWEGFAANPVGSPSGTIRRGETIIYDYTGQSKGSVLDDLKRILRVSDDQVIIEPDPNRTVDYRVEIGTSYNSCVYGNAEDDLAAGPPVEDAQ